MITSLFLDMFSGNLDGYMITSLFLDMFSGNLYGYILQVVDVDNVRQRAIVKLIPRIDLQALASKLVSYRSTF